MAANLKTTATVIPTDVSNTPCTLAAALTTNTAIEAGRGFIVSADIAGIQLLFAGAPATAISS